MYDEDDSNEDEDDHKPVDIIFDPDNAVASDTKIDVSHDNKQWSDQYPLDGIGIDDPCDANSQTYTTASLNETITIEKYDELSEGEICEIESHNKITEETDASLVAQSSDGGTNVDDSECTGCEIIKICTDEQQSRNAYDAVDVDQNDSFNDSGIVTNNPIESLALRPCAMQIENEANHSEHASNNSQADNRTVLLNEVDSEFYERLREDPRVDLDADDKLDEDSDQHHFWGKSFKKIVELKEQQLQQAVEAAVHAENEDEKQKKAERLRKARRLALTIQQYDWNKGLNYTEAMEIGKRIAAKAVKQFLEESKNDIIITESRIAQQDRLSHEKSESQNEDSDSPSNSETADKVDRSNDGESSHEECSTMRIYKSDTQRKSHQEEGERNRKVDRRRRERKERSASKYSERERRVHRDVKRGQDRRSRDSKDMSREERNERDKDIRRRHRRRDSDYDSDRDNDRKRSTNRDTDRDRSYERDEKIRTSKTRDDEISEGDRIRDYLMLRERLQKIKERDSQKFSHEDKPSIRGPDYSSDKERAAKSLEKANEKNDSRHKSESDDDYDGNKRNGKNTHNEDSSYVTVVHSAPKEIRDYVNLRDHYKRALEGEPTEISYYESKRQRHDSHSEETHDKPMDSSRHHNDEPYVYIQSGEILYCNPTIHQGKVIPIR
jgi:hypothetical protein